jgi:hypothetical protein
MDCFHDSGKALVYAFPCIRIGKSLPAKPCSEIGMRGEKVSSASLGHLARLTT